MKRNCGPDLPTLPRNRILRRLTIKSRLTIIQNVLATRPPCRLKRLSHWWEQVLAAVLICGCSASNPPSAPPVPPAAPVAKIAAPLLKFKAYNLVFVSFDAMQAAHVGALGNPRNVTPTLDSIAKQGYCFSNVYSVASWTVPASMTWFTGVYPSEHKMTNKYVP